MSLDGRPTLPTGEPVLARWFVLLLLPLIVIGIGVIIWAFLAIEAEPLPVAERRPPGSATVTHDRGEAALNDVRQLEEGPGCAQGITLVGDAGARAAGRRALGSLCQLVTTGSFPAVEEGLERWAAADGRLRFAVFELTGVDSSARIEDGRPVVELNARFQFEDATQAAPFVAHELVHLAGEWPGAAPSAEQELAAMEAQDAACQRLVFRDQPPRGCVDAEELLELEDPVAALRAAGYSAP